MGLPTGDFLLWSWGRVASTMRSWEGDAMTDVGEHHELGIIDG